MKKILLSIASTLFAVSVLFTGCSSKEEPTKINPNKSSFKNDKALYHKYLDSKAQDELAQELEKRKEK